MKRKSRIRLPSIQVCDLILFEIAIWYPTDPFMAIRIEITKLDVPSWKPIVKWSPVAHSLPVPMAVTLMNNCQSVGNVVKAYSANRILTSQYGFSHGTIVLKCRIGEKGIKGVGVCCRPCICFIPSINRLGNSTRT